MLKRTFQFSVPVRRRTRVWQDWRGLEPSDALNDACAVAVLCAWHPKFDWRVSPEPRLHGPQILDFVEVQS